MNHLYRIIWNESSHCWVAVMECARSRGKSHSTRRASAAAGQRPQSAVLTVGALALALALGGGELAWAGAPAANQLPTGANVVAGRAVVTQPAGAVLQVTQNSPSAVINWQSFNLGSSATVNFVQPSASSATLNRVLDSNPSQIYGRITAPGQVFFTNPSGMYFAPGSSVDVGGLAATTHSISDADFMAGNYRFERNGATGTIVNAGTLTAGLGGYIALLAPEVRNQGVVVARMGTVALAAGESYELQMQGMQLSHVRVSPASLKALVDNANAVMAPGGLVILSAQAANQLQGSVVNNSGAVVAQGLAMVNGRVVLDAGSNGAVTVSGSVSTAHADGKGGDITLTGQDIHLQSGSVLDASGSQGGGTVLVGGDWQGSGPLLQATHVTLDVGASIDVSALHSGDGGKVVLWSDLKQQDGTTKVHGSIAAAGGAQGGNGGQIETSGHHVDMAGVQVNAGAAQGDGGQWLIDPFNYTIAAAEASTIKTALQGGASVIVDTNNATATGAAVSGVSGAGDITVSSAIAKTSGGNASLTLTAGNNIVLDAGISSSAGTLTTTLNAGGGISGAGAINTNGGLLTLNAATTGTLSGIISGTGALTKSGAGTTTLTAANTYNGITTISGGTLQVGDGGATGNLGAGAVVNNGALVISRNNTVIVANAISGTGSVTQVGILSSATLSGNNTYTGATVVSSGTLRAGSNNAFGNNSALTMANASGGTLNLNGFNVSIGSLAGGGVTGGNVSLGTNTLTTGANNTSTSFSGVISGTGSLIKVGTGTLTLTRNNTYGATTINAGTLEIGAGGTAGSLGTGAVVDNGALVFNRTDTPTIANAISGSGSVTQAGSGTLTLSGANTYTGATAINAGALVVQTDSTSLTTSAFTGTGALTIAPASASFSSPFTVGSSPTFASTLSSLTVGKAGNAANILVNSATTIAGPITLVGGDITVNAALATSGGNTTLTMLAASNIVLNADITSGSGTLDTALTAGGSFTGNNNINTNGGLLTLNAAASSVLSGVVSGSGGLTTAGAGKLALAGNNTYTGATTVNSGGSLQIGNGGTSGAITSTVTNNGTLTYNRSDATTLTSLVTNVGSGNVVFAGSGKVTITNGGSITLPAATVTINSGSILEICDGISISCNLGPSNILINGELIYNIPSSAPKVLTKVFSGSGSLTLVGTSDITLTGTSTYGGTTTIGASAKLALGNATAAGSIGAGAIVDNGQLFINRSNSITLANAISGTGSLTQGSSTAGIVNASAGTTILTGSNSYGATTISGGTLQIGNGGSTGTLGSGAVTDNAALVFNRSADTTIANTISGTGTVDATVGGNLTVNGTVTQSNTVHLQATQNIALNAALTATGSTVTLASSTGTVTEGASGSVVANSLLLQGGNVTLTNTGNDVGTLAASGVGSLEYADSNALTLGTVGSTSGISASGALSVATLAGDLTLAQGVATSDTTSSALVLNAGLNAAAGTATGGNILVSGSPVLSVGAGGTEKLYSGSVSGSTGLTALVGAGSGHFRYASDEAANGYSLALATNAPNAIYREQPTITVSADDQTVTYGTAPTLTPSVSSQNGDTLAQAFSVVPTIVVGGTTSTSGNYTANTGHTLTVSAETGQLGYAIGYSNGSLTVNAKTVTLSADKTYDGSTSLTGAVAVGGMVGSETLNYTAATSNDAHVATSGKYINAITLTDGTLGGVASNYQLPTLNAANAAVTITAQALTSSATIGGTLTKTYTGTTAAPAATVSGTVSGAVSGDTITLDTSGLTLNYNSAHVVGASSIDDSGTAGFTVAASSANSVASDYSFAGPTIAAVGASITPATLTPTLSNTGVTKTYDGSTSAPTGFTPTYSYSGLVSGDSSAVLGNTGAAYNSAHVVGASQVTASGLSVSSITGSNSSVASDYVLDANAKTVAANITTKALTSSATIGGTLTKTYNGTTAATGASVGGTVSGAVSGDTITLDTSGLTLNYNSAHVVGASSIDDSGNAGFTIGTSSANSVASDYSFTGPTIAAVGASITPATLTPTLSNTGVTKTYDGTTSAPVGFTPAYSYSGLVSGDTGAVLGNTGYAYNSAHVVGASQVAVSGLTVSSITGSNSSAATDYVLDANAKTVTATITTKALTSSATIGGTLTKTYNGTTAATGASVSGTVSGAVAGDTITLDTSGLTLNYNSAHVVGASTIDDSGTAGFTVAASSANSVASDYSFAGPTIAAVGASITAATLTPTLSNTGVTKTYDGTTSAPVGFTPAYTFAGLVSGDSSAVLGNTGSAYDNSHVVGASQVTVSGLSVTSVTGSNSSAASDYVLDANAKTVAATITTKALSSSATIGGTLTKTYTGTAAAPAATVSGTVIGAVSGDTITLDTSGLTLNYNSAHVVGASSIDDSGTAGFTIGTSSATSVASDYSFTGPTIAAVGASITAAMLTPTLSNTGVTKAYDGTTSAPTGFAPAYTFAGLVSGDSSAVLGNTGSAYDNAHVVGASQVTVSGLTVTSITGSNSSAASDYVLDASSKAVAATITTKALSSSATIGGTLTKTYTGTTAATGASVSGTVSGAVTGDTITLDTSGLTLNYNSAHVVGASSIDDSGTAGFTIGASSATSVASDYSFTGPTIAAVGASITAATLTPTLSNTGVTKTYDGTTSAPAGFAPTFSYSGLVSGDTGAVLGNTGAAYNSAHVVGASQVTVSGLSVTSITGSNSSVASDYVLDANSKTVAATITTKALTSSATIGGTLTKTYNGTTAAPAATVSGTVTGAVSGDTITLDTSGLTLNYNSAHVVGASSIDDSGTASFTIGASSANSVASDYSFTSPTIAAVAASITPATLTPTLSNTGVTKTYDGATSAPVGFAPTYSYSGLVSGDTGAVLGNTGYAYNSAHVVGASQVTVSGLTVSSITGSNSSAASDYVLDLTAKTVTATITTKALTSSATIGGTLTRTYNGTTAATGASVSGTVSGAVAGDTVTLDTSGLTLNYNSAHVVGASTIDDSGSTGFTIGASSANSVASDYSFTGPTIAAVGANITPATLTPTLSNTGVTKTYDGTTSAPVGFTPTYTFAGLASGDTGGVLGNTGSAYNSAHVVGASQVTVSGLSVSSITGSNNSAASDYVLDANSKTVAANITTKALSSNATIGGTLTKTYTGTTIAPAASVSGTVADAVTGDTLTLDTSGLTLNYNSAHVVGASSIDDSGTASFTIGTSSANSVASDYSFTSPTIAAVGASITPATLTPTLSNTGVTKTYDGTTSAPVGFTPAYSYSGLVSGDTGAVLGSTGSAYNNAHVVGASQITVSGLTVTSITGSNSSAASDYVLDANAKTVAATITTKALTSSATIGGALTKTYTGTAAAPAATVSGTVTGAVSGDTITLDTSGLTLNYNSAHAVGASTIDDSGTAGFTVATSSANSVATDYSFTGPTIAAVGASITAATLTPTISNTGVTKAYDGTTSAPAGFAPTYSYSGFVGGDTGAALGNTGSAYNNAHVIGASQVTVSGLTVTSITGSNSSAATDYVLDANAKTVTATITTKALTSSATIGGTLTRTYNGTTAATGASVSGTVSGAVTGDTITLDTSGLTLNYNSAHVVGASSIDDSGSAGFTIGTSSANSVASDYSFTGPTIAAVGANITPATLTPTLSNTGVTKTYDGTTSAPAGFAPTFSYSGLVSGDTGAVLGNTGAAYNSAHVVGASQVTVSGLSVSSINGSNSSVASDYVLDLTAKTVAATITTKALTSSATIGGTLTKTYTGTTAAPAATVSGTVTGAVSGDTLTLDTSGLTLNYNSAHVVGASSIDDSGSAGFTIGTSSANSVASDYSFAGPTIAAVGASITPATLTPTLSNTGVTKTYDGTTSAPVGFTPAYTFAGLVSGDSSAVLGSTGSAYNNAHMVGASQITVSGLTVTSITGGNSSAPTDYVLDANAKTVTATITTKALTSSATIGGTLTKTYTGTTAAPAATVSGTVSGAVSGDTITLDTSGLTLNYNSAHVVGASSIDDGGTANFTIDASSANSVASDYSFAGPTIAAVGASITPATLTPTLSNTGVTKTYDGTTSAPVGFTPAYTFAGLVSGDTGAVLGNTGAAYNSAHVVGASQVTVSGLSIGSITGSSNSSAATDYVLDANAKAVAATITTKALTSSATIGGTLTKTYNGTTAATGASVSGTVTGAVTGDTVTLDTSGLTLNYNSAHVVGASTIDDSGSTGFTIGASSANSVASDYSFTGPTIAAVGASITAATLTPTLSNTGVTKTYDGTTSAPVGFTPTYTFAGLVSGDSSAALDSTGYAYNSAHVVGASQVTVSGLTVSSITGGNSSAATDYVLDASSKTVAANITQRDVTLASLSASNKTYDGNTAATISSGSFANLAGTETLAVSGAGTFDNRNAGSAKTVTVSDVSALTKTGGTGVWSDYHLSTTGSLTASADIAKKPLTLTASSVGKTYDGLLSYTALGSDLAALTSQLGISADTVSAATIAYTDKNAGSGKTVTLSNVGVSDGNSGNNYSITLAGNSTSSITKANATVTGNSDSTRIYNGNIQTLSGFSVSGLVNAETASVLTGVTASGSGKNAGNYAVTPSGTDGNYNLNFVDGVLHINKAVLTAGLTGSVQKEYDGLTSVGNLVNGNFLVGGWASGEGAAITQTAGTYASKNVSDNTGNGLVSTTIDNSQLSALAGTDLNNYVLPTAASGNVGRITPAPLTVKVNGSVTFVTLDANNAPDHGYVFTGLKNGESANSVLGTLTRSYTGASATPGAGTYSAVYGVNGTPVAANGNYSVTVSKGDLLVSPADIIIINIENQSATYGALNASNASASAQLVSVDYMLGGASLAQLTMQNMGNGLWQATDLTGQTLSFSTLVNSTGALSSGGYLKVGNYTYGASASSGSARSNFGGEVVNGGTLNVTPRQLTLSSGSVSKPYDGSTNVRTVVLTPENKLPGDALTVTVGSGSFAGKNAGTQNFDLSGLGLANADQANYSLPGSTFSGSGTITPKSVTLSASDLSKTYDGSNTYTASALDLAQLSSTLGVAADQVSAVTIAFANPAAGATKTVSTSAASIQDGNGGGNYQVAYADSSNNQILQKEVNLIGVTGANKTYDGNTQASIVSGRIVGTVGSETLGISGTATFADRNAASGKVVTVADISTLTRTDGSGLWSNYHLGTSGSLTTTADILRKPVTLTAASVSKTYDGLWGYTTQSADLNPLSSQLGISGDSVSAATIVYADKNAGTGNKAVALASVTVSDGNFGNNYDLTLLGNNNSTINKANAVVTGSSDSTRIYNGATQTVTGFDATGLVNAETAAVLSGVSASGSGKDVGSYAVIPAGTDANYNLSFVNGSLQVNPHDITLSSLSAANKTYDGNTSASITAGSFNNVVAGETLSISGAGNFADKNAATGKTVTVSDVATLTKSDGTGLWSNYHLSTSGSFTTLADINPRDITLNSLSAANKTYDGTASASIAAGSFGNVVSGETLGISGVGNFADKNAAIGKTVTVSDIAALTRTDGTGLWNNYHLTSTGSLATSADIAKKSVTLTGGDVSKTYDGLTSYSTQASDLATLSSQLGISGDSVSAATIAYTDKNAGAGNKTITLSSVGVVDGNSGNNYTLTLAGNSSSSIARANAVVTGNSDSTRIYDGSTQTLTGFSAAGLVNAETPAVLTGVSASGSGKDVGSYAVIPAGTDANYNLSFVNGSLQVNPRDITLNSLSAANKTYDGTASASIAAGSFGNVVSGETLGISGAGNFADKNAATGKTVTVSDVATLTKTDGTGLWSNYHLTSTGSLATSADIARKSVTLTAGDVSKTYDGLTSYSTQANDLATLSSQLGISGDSVSAATIAYTDKNAGVGNKTITLSSVDVVDGNSGNNYTLTLAGNSNSSITKAPLFITANDASKNQDGVPFSGGNGVFYAGFVAGEGVAALGGMLNYAGNSQGAVAAGDYAIAALGLSAQNYLLNYVPGTLHVLGVLPTAAPEIPHLTATTADSVIPSGTAPAVPTSIATIMGLTRRTNAEPGVDNVRLQVVRPASEESPGFTLVYVPSSLKSAAGGFRFALPESSTPGETRDGGVRVTTLDGDVLPDWLRLDPGSRLLVASKVPPGGLPLRVLVISGGKRSVLELLETNS